MELKQFEGEHIDEVSMIRVAKAILEEKGEVMSFHDIIHEVADFIEIDEEEMNRRMPQFYTDINVDGEFISLGENTWGLRTWYPVDSINEVLTHENAEEDMIPQISEDGFDDYEDVAVAEEFKEELEEENEDEDFEIDEDEETESLDEYQDNLNELEDTELEGLEVVDDDEILEDDEDEEEGDDL